MGPKKVTLQAIADQLSISKFAVSRALSDKPGVSAETRHRVLMVAKQLGYSLPQRNRERQKGVIVLLIRRDMTQDTSYWPHVLMGIQEGATAQGATLAIAAVSEEDQNRLELPATVSRLQPVGIVCIGLRAHYIAHIREAGYPVVLVDQHVPELELDAVMADNYAGAWSAVRYLIAKGHRQIGFIGHHPTITSFYQRMLGYRKALEEAGIPFRPEWCLMPEEQGGAPWDAAWLRRRLQGLTARPTAWFCGNDLTALTWIRVLGEAGLRVPTDVSVIGFDDIPEAVRSAPPLTTMQVYKELIGIRCVQRLDERVNAPDDPPDLIQIRTRLIERDSVRTISP